VETSEDLALELCAEELTALEEEELSSEYG
jgi:hypothetical protein